jgi:uncharacterized protein YqhQ
VGWLGSSSPWGFEIRGEGLVCSVDAREVRVGKARTPLPFSLASLFALLGTALFWREALVLLAPLALAFLGAFLLRFGAFRRWHGAEHKVVEALLLVEKGVEPEEAWRRAKTLSPACGTVALGMALPIGLALYALYPPLAVLAPPLAMALHLKLPRSSPLRLPGLLLQRLFVAEPGPLEEARARRAFSLLAAVLRERR